MKKIIKVKAAIESQMGTKNGTPFYQEITHLANESGKPICGEKVKEDLVRIGSREKKYIDCGKCKNHMRKAIAV